MPQYVCGYHDKRFEQFKKPSEINPEYKDKSIKCGLELEWEFGYGEDGYYDDDGDWIEPDTDDYTCTRLVRKLNNAGLYPISRLENIPDNTLDFCLEQDGSLMGDSCEFVSRPLNFHPNDLSDIEFLKNVMKILNDNYDIDKVNSGMHVHINQDDFYHGDRTRANLCILLFCYIINAPHNWDNLFDWSERTDEEHTREYADRQDILYDGNNLQYGINKILKTNQSELEELIKEYFRNYLHDCTSKYSTTHIVNSYNTLEIRIFNTTDNFDVVVNRLTTIYNMIECCRTLVDKILDDRIEIKLNDIEWKDFISNKFTPKEIGVGTILYSATNNVPFIVIDYEQVTQTFKLRCLKDRTEHLMTRSFKLYGAEIFGRMFNWNRVKGDKIMKNIKEIVEELGLKYQPNFDDLENGKNILYVLWDKVNGLYYRSYNKTLIGLGGFIRVDGDNYLGDKGAELCNALKENEIAWDEVQLYLLEKYQAALIGVDYE